MGVEQLQLLVRFSNVTTLLPFRMVLDEITGKFKRFDSHWRHPSNWWFTFILISQLSSVCLIVHQICSKLMNASDSSLTLAILIFIFYLFNYFALIFVSPRIFLFRFRHLETAIEILNRIDRILDKIFLQPQNCKTRHRAIIGISISSLIVSNLQNIKNKISNYF